MSDDIREPIAIAQQVAAVVEQTLAPLLLALTGARPEFRQIVLGAVGRRALAFAAEAAMAAAEEAEGVK